MAIIRIIIAAAIIYGSLFPFDFQFAAPDSETFRAFLNYWDARASRGDVLGNIVLFVPLGLAGTIMSPRGTRVWTHTALTLIASVLLAAALQYLQLYLPSRTAALNDVLWNLVGTGIGCVGGLLLSGRVVRWTERKQSLQAIPLILLCCWGTLRLTPFVPSIDLQVIKNSLKPLLLAPEISLAGVVANAAGWLVAAYMMQQLMARRVPGLVLGLAMTLTFALEVLVVDNSVTASNVAGAGAAWLLGFVAVSPGRKTSLALAGILAAVLVIRGLAPFAVRTSPAEFSWLPFADFLGGAMYHNTLVIIEKTFLYGSLIYFLRSVRSPWLVCIASVAVILALVEIAQLFFAYHTPGITDPILAVILGIAIMALEAQARAIPSESAADRHRHPAPRLRQES